MLKAFADSRPLLWLVLALPGLWIAGRWTFTPDLYGYGHAIGDSGDWAAWLLMATLAVTPLRLLLRRQSERMRRLRLQQRILRRGILRRRRLIVQRQRRTMEKRRPGVRWGWRWRER